MKKFNYTGMLILSFLMVTQNGLFAQNADDKKLQIIAVPGYQYPTAINPSMQTVPAQQISGVLSSDATDIRVFASSNPQSEIHTSISKANPQNILISAQTYFGTSVQGYYYSNNGGTTWAGADQLPNNVVGRGDPTTAFDYDGNGYLVSMAATSSSASPDGYFVQKTLNGGSTWQTQVRGVTQSNFDKEMVAVDNMGTSPYKNYFYCAWTDFTGSYSVKLNRSINGGSSFTTPVTLKSGWGQGTNVQTGPNGEVYVCWANYGTGTYPANGIGFSKSLDGGATFATTVPFAYTGIRVSGTNPLFNNTRVNDFPSMSVDKSEGSYKGRIYIVYPEKENGNGKAIIRMRYSDDKGVTWSAALTVSISNGTQSWFPWVAVDDFTGHISIVYYSFDDANSSYSTNTYVAHSSDGGATFENIKVSDVAHITAPIPGFGGGYAGDYIGICAYGNKAFPVWADNRNGTWQVYVSPLTYVDTLTVSQKNSLGNTVGNVSRWNGSAFSAVTLDVPYTVPSGSTEVLKGEQTVISNQKYNIWANDFVNEPDVKNHHTFPVTRKATLTSKLTKVASASLKVKLDGIDYPTGSVKFKDPWLIDFADATYGGTMRNRGMTDALLTPVTSADNNLGTGSSFKGVFKNLDPINPQVTTYYKIQSDNTETFGGQVSYFQNWSATGATVTNTTSGTEQPVVFTADNAVVTGNYKGHLRTGVPNNSDAKNQRRLVSSTQSTNNLQMIYESMGEVWFTVSYDNGATWSKEVRLSSGNGTAKNPTFSNMIRYKKTDGTFASGPDRLVAAWVEGTDIHLQTLMDFDWLGWISYPAGSSVQTSDNHRVLSSLGIIGSQPRSTGSRPVLNFRQSGNNIILTVAYEGQNTGIIGTTVVFTGNGQNIVGDLSSAVTAPLASSLGGPDDLEITTGTTDEYPVIFNTPAVYGYAAKEAIYYLGSGYASGRRIVEYNTSIGSKTLLSTAYGDYTYTYLQGAVSAENATAALVAGAQVNDANGTHYNVNLYGKATYTTGVPSLSTTYTNYTQATVAVQPNSGFGSGTPTNQIYMKNTSTNVWYKANGATTIGSNVSGFYLPERFSALASLNTVVNRTAVNGVAATPSVLERYQNSTATQLNKTNSNLAINVRGFRFFTPINESEQMTILDFSGSKVEIIDSLETGKLLVAVKVLETSDNGVIVSQNDSLQVELGVDVVRGGNTIRSYSASEWSALTSQSIGGLESGDILLFRLPFNVSSSWGYEEVNFGESSLAKENVEEKEGSELKAKEFSVSAYPNPFNPQTTFRITLPNIQFVTLEVYNMLGQRVQTLVNGKLEAGEHNFQFNGTNLATGTYIYRLNANDKVQSGKIVLMK